MFFVPANFAANPGCEIHQSMRRPCFARRARALLAAGCYAWLAYFLLLIPGFGAGARLREPTRPKRRCPSKYSFDDVPALRHFALVGFRTRECRLSVAPGISRGIQRTEQPYASPAESATTHILTLYTGYEVTHTTEVFADLEDATGGGIGNAVGLAGVTNLDDVRTVQGIQLSRAPYLARLILRQIIPLSSERVSAERSPLGLATSLPARRIEIRAGKFDLADFFDNNSGGSDTHLQFLNWTVDNNGAWDYAANTRGYTDGAFVEYDDHRWAARFAETLMPKVANGIHLDAALSRAHAENFELELHRTLLPHREGIFRVLTFVNHANMGVYSEAVGNFLAGRTATPDITAHPEQETVKYGFGGNFEQPLNDWLGVFGRWGWNEGQHESYAYTEVDQTVLIGLNGEGERWRRKLDRFGLAFVSNGISARPSTISCPGRTGLFTWRRAVLTMAAKISLKPIIRFICGVEFIRRLTFSTSTIRGYNRDRGPLSWRLP